MKKIMLLLSVLATMFCTSCSMNKKYKYEAALEPLVRAKIVESGVITQCRLTSDQKWTLQSGDSVWLDVATHRIDDTARFTMKAVLQ